MYVRGRVPWMRPEDCAHTIEGLRRAGLPEEWGSPPRCPRPPVSDRSPGWNRSPGRSPPPSPDLLAHFGGVLARVSQRCREPRKVLCPEERIPTIL